jgi:hypothetical protein
MKKIILVFTILLSIFALTFAPMTRSSIMSLKTPTHVHEVTPIHQQFVARAISAQ